MRIAFLCVLMLALGAGLAHAAERVWDNGSVWSIQYAETKPGQFDAYIADLKKNWKRYTDREMKDGDVLSYHLLNVASPRDGEPNVIFLVEYKNWAAFDRGIDYFDKLAAEIFGSTERADAASIDREALRSLRGSLIAQEIVFK